MLQEAREVVQPRLFAGELTKSIVSAQDSDDYSIATEAEVIPQPAFDFPAHALGDLADGRLLGNRGHSLAVELAENVMADSAHEARRPSPTGNRDMNVGTFEIVEQDGCHDLTFPLNAHG